MCLDVRQWWLLCSLSLYVRDVRSVDGVCPLCVVNGYGAVTNETLLQILEETGLRWPPDVSIEGPRLVRSSYLPTSEEVTVLGYCL